MAFELTSPAFGNNQPIPAKYTGDGDNLSPPLTWQDPPAGTRSFALVVEDPDAPSGVFRHWGIYDIKPDRRHLPEGAGHGVRAEDFSTAVNDFGQPAYGGPAPPHGHGTHHYHFKLAALNIDKLPQKAGAEAAEIWRSAQNHIIAQVELIGTYAR